MKLLELPAIGPVNGHNFEELLPALEAVKAMKGVRLLHVITTKGKGFEQAEKDQVRYHAPGIFDRLTGDLPDAQPVEDRIPLYQEVLENFVGIGTAKSKDCGCNACHAYRKSFVATDGKIS